MALAWPNHNEHDNIIAMFFSLWASLCKHGTAVLVRAPNKDSRMTKLTICGRRERGSHLQPTEKKQ